MRGLSPTRSALLLARSVGKLTDRIHPRLITSVGFVAIIVSQGRFAEAMSTAMLPPPAILLLGLLAVLFFERPRHTGHAPQAAPVVAPVVAEA